jgi:hypothetical protein
VLPPRVRIALGAYVTELLHGSNSMARHEA